MAPVYKMPAMSFGDSINTRESSYFNSYKQKILFFKNAMELYPLLFQILILVRLICLCACVCVSVCLSVYGTKSHVIMALFIMVITPDYVFSFPESVTRVRSALLQYQS